MEKLAYVLWRRPEVPVEAFRDDLVGARGQRLLELGARGLAVSVADRAFSPASSSAADGR